MNNQRNNNTNQRRDWTFDRGVDIDLDEGQQRQGGNREEQQGPRGNSSRRAQGRGQAQRGRLNQQQAGGNPGRGNNQPNLSLGPGPYCVFEDVLFWMDFIVIRENNLRTTFSPSCVGLIPIATGTWQQLMVDNSNIHNEVIPEAVRYYATCLLWARIIRLKRANAQPRTAAERAFLRKVGTTTFNVPAPLHSYLAAIGNIKDLATGQSLIPSFPPLPTQVVGAVTGTFGAVAADTHALYEEFPTLGVVAESLRNAIGDGPAGDYASSLALEHAAVNGNMCGYVPLLNRRIEAKQMALACGITADEISESIANTAFNYDFMFAMSEWFSNTRTFAIKQINFMNFGIQGSQAQLLIERSVPSKTANARNVDSNIIATSMMRATDSVYGEALYGAFQLMKDSSVIPDANASVNSRAWCCVTFLGAEGSIIPAAWIDNRNARRNLPDEFNARRFETISQPGRVFRARIVGRLVIARR